MSKSAHALPPPVLPVAPFNKGTGAPPTPKTDPTATTTTPIKFAPPPPVGPVGSPGSTSALSLSCPAPTPPPLDVHVPSASFPSLPFDYEFQGLAVWAHLDSETERVIAEINALTATHFAPAPLFPPHLTVVYGVTDTPTQSFCHSLHEAARAVDSPSGLSSGFDSLLFDQFEPMMMRYWSAECGHQPAMNDLRRLTVNALRIPDDGTFQPHASLLYTHFHREDVTYKALYEFMERTPEGQRVRAAVESLPTLPWKIDSLAAWDLNGTCEEWKLVDRVHITNLLF